MSGEYLEKMYAAFETQRRSVKKTTHVHPCGNPPFASYYSRSDDVDSRSDRDVEFKWKSVKGVWHVKLYIAMMSRML